MSYNDIIGMAWSDRVSFEEIKKKTGYSENEVIKLMRKNLKRKSNFGRGLQRRVMHQTNLLSDGGVELNSDLKFIKARNQRMLSSTTNGE